MDATCSTREIVDYYDNCHVDYAIVWHLNTHLSLHYGYWEEGTKRLRDALIRMNEVLAEKVGIAGSDKVLDAGCGVGGAAIFLAKKFGCSVDGITLSRKQVEFAGQKATENNIQDKVSFTVADFTRMPFEDESFDVVWAVESVCHAEDKGFFLKEAQRVLKKGGRLIVADFFRTRDSYTTEENDLMHNWAESWAVTDFEYIKQFENKAKENGFASIRTNNITHNILPSAKRLYYCFVPGIICDGFLRILGRRKKIHQANVWSTYYQFKSLKKELWNYFTVMAIKE
jgi:cyclopropane fatty-acyl-phospholipid synthase-like methyltransferase